MKPFNLKDALAGKPVITRRGEKVLEIHCFNGTSKDGYKLAALVEGRTDLLFFTADGRYSSGESNTNSDLVMAPAPPRYKNVYMGGPYALTYEERGKVSVGASIYASEKEALEGVAVAENWRPFYIGVMKLND